MEMAETFEEMNDRRADWALIAVTAFRGTVVGATRERDPLEEVIMDLLGDLMHLCHREGLPFRSMLKEARWHYRHELRDAREERDASTTGQQEE